jgi:hypothetical protein
MNYQSRDSVVPRRPNVKHADGRNEIMKSTDREWDAHFADEYIATFYVDVDVDSTPSGSPPSSTLFRLLGGSATRNHAHRDLHRRYRLKRDVWVHLMKVRNTSFLHYRPRMES